MHQRGITLPCSTMDSSPLSPSTVRALPAVEAMFADVAAGAEVVQPSAYWDYINRCNVEQIERDGFDRFKRSINQNYFSFVPCDMSDDQYRAARRAWKAQPNPSVLLPRRIDVSGLTSIFADRLLMGRRHQLGHARYLAMLWEYVRRRDHLGLLMKLEEPDLGDPITVRYRHRRISQDLCNSVHEFYSATEGYASPRHVIEIGGGYGRVGWVLLSALPGLRYLMCDIPPALAIAQRYLTTLFPDRPAFTFRRFDEYAEIADEFESAAIAFITPGQLQALPPQQSDLVINISSLHEMRRDQIAFYLHQIERHCAGAFYTKQWLKSVNTRDDLVLRREDYPIPDHWREIYSRQHEIQTLFFEALYQVK
jgi:putative sugar O-methyltransferase